MNKQNQCVSHTDAEWSLLGLSALQNVNLVDDQKQSHRREDDEEDQKPNDSFVIICKSKGKLYQSGGIHVKDTMYRNGCVSNDLTEQYETIT